MTAKPKSPETDPAALHAAILARLPHRSTASGVIRWPAVPALLDHYTQTLVRMFAGLGRSFDADEERHLRGVLAAELARGFEASPFSKLVVEYHTDPPAHTAISYTVSIELVTMEDEYAEWVRSRQPPLFGANPDAKVLSLARALGPANQVAVLDVGAGTGRNTLPLARAGYRVDAVELAPSLASVLRKDLEQAGARGTRVFEGDALDPALGVPEGAYQLIVLAEVVASHFRDVGQLRALFERAQSWLAPGGLLLFSAFVASGDYQPDRLAKQASQVFWCCLFTRDELANAARGLDLVRISDESTYAFEKQHLADSAWPPTGWFSDWAHGRDLFHLPQGKPPHELRWLVYRKNGEHEPRFSDTYATTASLHMRAARERVFELAFDPASVARIFRPFAPVPGIAKVELVADAQRRTTWSDASVTTETVLERTPPYYYAYRFANTFKGPLAWIFSAADVHWTFAPTDSGTNVYWTVRFEPRMALTRRFMNIVQAGFRRWMRESLQALRQQVEQS
ncbi:MAG TPA: methyltransferase domain-containing protein [Polyangiales bacterium]|nr:methyltransferase domain-containing protein [Polyangiales bacterium]